MCAGLQGSIYNKSIYRTELCLGLSMVINTLCPCRRQYRQISPKIAKDRQISPNITKYHQISPESEYPHVNLHHMADIPILFPAESCTNIIAPLCNRSWTY